MSTKAVASTESPAFRLLDLEQAEFERFLHDDLGQCLVAIRSMAAALEDEPDPEIGTLIAQTADDAYIEVYDLMMELRAEGLAGEPVFTTAVRQCIDDARLESLGLARRLQLDDGIEGAADPICRRLLLRCLRGVIAVLKRGADSEGELVVEIENSDEHLRLSMQLLPGGFPDALGEHPRMKRLESRISAFGGRLLHEQAARRIHLTLPCRQAVA